MTENVLNRMEANRLRLVAENEAAAAAAAAAAEAERKKPRSNIVNRMEANRRKKAMEPKLGQEDVRGNYGETLMRGIGRGATMGWGEKASAGVQGRPAEEVLAEGRAFSDQNPKTNMLGEIIGGVGSMAFAAPKALGLGLKGLSKLVPLAGEVSKKLAAGSAATNSIVGRAGKTMALGAGEGAIYNEGQNLSPLTGALMGATMGFGGQLVLGEALPALWRGATGSKGGRKQQAKIQQQAENEILSILRANNQELADPEIAAKLAKIATDLGPQATIADLEEAIYDAGMSSIKSRADLPNARNLMRTIQERHVNNPHTFAANVDRAVGSDRLLSVEGMAAKAAADFKAHSGTFDTVVKGSDMQYAPKNVATLLSNSFSEVYTDAATGARTRTPVIGASKTAQAEVTKLVNDIVQQKRVIPGSKAKWKPSEITLSPTDLVAIRAQIDKRYSTATGMMDGAADKELMKHLATARSNINAMLNDVKGFKDINEQYADTHMMKEAHEFGTNWLFNNKKDPADVGVFLQTATANQLTAFLHGTKYELARRLQLPKGYKNIGKLSTENALFMEKLRSTVGPELSDAILASARDLSQYAKQDKKFLKAAGEASGKVPPGIITSGSDAVVAGLGLLTPHVSSAAGLGAGRRTLAKAQGTGPRITSAATDIMSLSGADLKKQLDILGKGGGTEVGPTLSDAMGMGAAPGALANQDRER